MVAVCQHCGNGRVLVARVTSTILDQIVCDTCALLALRLLSGHDDVHGALTVVPLRDDPYTFQPARN
jgi:hypothetical protein